MTPDPEATPPGSDQRDLLSTDNALKRFVVKRQWPDWIFGLLACYVASRFWSHRTIEDLDPAGRRAIYQTASAIATALFGLTMTSVSILTSNLDKPLGGMSRGMPRGLIRAVARTMFGSMRALAVLLMTGVTLLIIDTQPGCGLHWTTPLLTLITVVVALRASRVTYLLSRFLRARTTQ